MSRAKGFILLDSNVCYVKLYDKHLFGEVRVDDCFVVTKFPNLVATMNEFTIDEFFSALLTKGIIEEVEVGEYERNNYRSRVQ